MITISDDIVRAAVKANLLPDAEPSNIEMQKMRISLNCALELLLKNGGVGINEPFFEIQELRDELLHKHILVSQAINTLEQVKIALEDGDVDEALSIITGATS